MRVITILVAIILLSSCTASWHVRRAMQKDPTIFVTDTIVQYDTVWVEVAKIDTLFKYNFDTVEFWKDSVYVKYFYEVQDSTVYIEVDCPDSEVITETKTITETITLKPTFFQKIKYSLIVIIMIAAVIMGNRLFRK